MDGSRCVWSLSHEVNRLTQISSAPSVSSAVSSNYHIKWKGSKKCANASVRSVFGSARQGVGFRRPCATLGVGLVAARPVPPTAALPQTPARMPASFRFSGALGKAWDSAAPALRWASAFAALRRDKPDWSQRDQCHQLLRCPKRRRECRSPFGFRERSARRGIPPPLRCAGRRTGRSATSATNRCKGTFPGAAWDGKRKLIVFRRTRQV